MIGWTWNSNSALTKIVAADHQAQEGPGLEMGLGPGPDGAVGRFDILCFVRPTPTLSQRERELWLTKHSGLEDFLRIGVAGAEGFGVARAAGRAAIAGKGFLGLRRAVGLSGIVFFAA